jgi:hypothetical protein
LGDWYSGSFSSLPGAGACYARLETIFTVSETKALMGYYCGTEKLWLDFLIFTFGGFV